MIEKDGEIRTASGIAAAVLYRPGKLGEHPAALGARAVIRSVVTNALLATVKCVAGVAGHSYALVADGVESFSDVVSSLVAYLGLRVALRPADADHPYGHGKAEPLAAIVVAMALVAAAITIAVLSVHEILTPHTLPAPFTLVVLVGVIVVKTFLSRYTARVGATIESVAVRGDSAHHLSDAITSTLAFVGTSLGIWLRAPQADDWAALCAVPIVAANGLRQLRAPLAELLDAAPGHLDKDVRKVAMSVPGVRALGKCLVRKTGFDYYVDLDICVDGNVSVREGHAIADDVEREIKERLPRVASVLVHVEPDTPQAASTTVR